MKRPIAADDIVPPIGGTLLHYIARARIMVIGEREAERLEALAGWLDRYTARLKDAVDAVEAAKGAKHPVTATSDATHH